MKKKTALFVTLVLLTVPVHLSAINFYDGVRAPDGLYFLSYSSWYFADRVNDVDGDMTENNFGFHKVQNIFRLAWYHKGLVATVVVPVGGAYAESLSDGSFGVGNISAGVGWFIPVSAVDLLPMFFVTFPSGPYDSGSSINYGTGQYDLKFFLYAHKSFGDFTCDGVFKYHLRLKEESSNVKPGDEIHLQLVAGYNFFSKVRFGPSFSYSHVMHKKSSGSKVSGSGKDTVSLGCDLSFAAGAVKLTLTYLGDVMSRNSTMGHYMQLKSVVKCF